MIDTEKRNPSSTHIDKMTCDEMASVMSRANMEAADAVRRVESAVAKAIGEISARMRKGGRLFYIGCGTSGRLGVLDASECPPTYGVSPELVVGIIAGGEPALRNAVEHVEDSSEQGKADLREYNITENDSVIGISVAGNAAYVAGAIELAKEAGALTVGLTCNRDCLLTRICELSVVTETGPEIITGSTRMKAGTAHKMVLNMISTGVMIRIGRVYENYMIHIRPVNMKLKNRLIRMMSDLAHCSEQDAERLLENNEWKIDKGLKEYHKKCSS